MRALVASIDVAIGAQHEVSEVVGLIQQHVPDTDFKIVDPGMR